MNRIAVEKKVLNENQILANSCASAISKMECCA